MDEMVLDRIISSYVRYILIPKVLRLDIPGFIIEDFTRVGQNTILRVVFLPEGLFIRLEYKLKPSFLYFVGKKFSYSYSQISNLPTIKNLSLKNFLRFVSFYIKFVEGTQSSGFSHKVDIKRKLFQLKMKNYVVCSRNGKGYLLPLGGVAGIWAWMLQDLEIEAVQPKCEGRGDNSCVVLAAPYQTLREMGYKPLKFTSIEKIQLDYSKYNTINKIRTVTWAKNSLKNMIDAGLLKYEHGIIKYFDERFFLCGVELIYILEKELKKIKNGLKILWDCSFDFGKRLAEISGKQEPCKFIMDFFPALGFGDILASRKEGRYEIFVKYFPWLEWYKDIDFTMFRGMLSGVISGFTEKNVKLKKIVKDIRGRDFILYLTEK
ncbi:MAG: hypothetical protein QXU71_00490 [Candidatus Aenigmatarchaeota archaeon]